MKVVSFFAGAGGLDLGFEKQALTLSGLMNMIEKYGKLMKRTINILC